MHFHDIRPRNGGKVENTLAELKHFKVLAGRFQHDSNIYNDTFRAVVALVNLYISRRVTAALA
jgi:transposase-like protein